MIDWTDAAIEAAIRGWFDTDDAFRPRMRAALNAAVQAQGDMVVMPYKTFCETSWGVRADALEESAKVADEQADECDSRYPSDTARMIAAAIRALKEKKG